MGAREKAERVRQGASRGGDRMTGMVFATYVLVQLAPFLYAVSRAHFYHSGVEPLATAVYFGVIVALVRRRRWAWVLLSGLNTVVLISYIVGGGPTAFVVTNAVALALLWTPQVRSYVGLAQVRR